ncbi:MAG: WD40/YVTN/BNR-like repeat-containing protein [Candidatus Komeilibacteria bacterium]
MKKIQLISLIMLVAVFSTGCIVKVGTSPVGRQGGVFVSEDAGVNWANISRLLSTEENASFLGTDIINMTFDPQVSSTIYAGTLKNGIFFTLDSGRSWTQTLTGVGTIYDVAVHPYNKCYVFAATGKQLYRTHDCARTWQPVLLETRNDEVLNRLAVDDSDSPILYAGSNMGAMYKSLDAGNSWQAMHFFDAGIADIIIAPSNFNTIYVGLTDKGIFKSTDRGASFTSITESLHKKYAGFANFHKLVISELDNSLIYANEYSIAKSYDGGSSWELLNLLTPPRSVYIYGLAVSALDSNIIYYTSHDTIYKSVDGGDNWSTTSMPTSKVLDDLLISPTNNSVIYGGAANTIK